MFEALGCRGCLETLDANTLPCPEICLESYIGPGSNICLAMLSSVEVG
jgi:hypothetical protein